MAKGLATSLPKAFAVARRISGMSPAEIRTRATMAIRQRLDLWEARRGKNPLQPRRSGQTGVIPRFFFDAGDAAVVAAEVRRRLPSACAGVVESAQRIRERHFDLLGYRGLSFGDRNIEWQQDPVHRIAAPVEPWYRVPYLDFNQVGDHKIIWELSRHQHLMLLARAWLYSGDRQFLDTLQNLWQDWRQANPYPMGINWASTLEVAFRCLSWIWVDHMTVSAADFPESLRAKLRDEIGQCAVYIERYLSTYFAPNTHLLGEVLALFFVGVLYPGFERAQHWREFGWRMLLQEASRQVRADGFHFEQSVYYHVYALDMFLHARILAARNGFVIPESYDSTLRLMTEGLLSIGAAGEAPRFGDDDGGRLFDGRRNHAEHMLDPIAAAAIVYGRGDWKASADEVCEETIWLLGVDGVRSFDQLAVVHQVPRSRAFTTSGYYTMASASGMAVVDAGPHGWGRGGHGHADALSLQLIAGGRTWLTDPGTGSYPREKPERDLLRGTAAHNTLEVDGVSQADPVHAFAWDSHPVTSVHRWYSSEKISLFCGSHNGYARLASPVTHRRWVIAWQDNLWIVADRASGDGVHVLELRWHVAPECTLTTADLSNAWHLSAGRETVEIVIPPGEEWQTVCESANWSPAYGAVIPAPVLRFSRQGPLPADCVTVLALNPIGHVSLRRFQADGASVYHLIAGESRRLIVLAERPGVWHFETMESDAELLAIEYSGATIRHALVSGASKVNIGGEPLALERHIDGVCELAVDPVEQPWLNLPTITAFLSVLEHLSGSAPSSVASGIPRNRP
ncbi:MAG TPA: alginate lyase family protein [Candidatus Sulfotelmatobacter sp.]